MVAVVVPRLGVVVVIPRLGVVARVVLVAVGGYLVSGGLGSSWGRRMSCVAPFGVSASGEPSETVPLTELSNTLPQETKAMSTGMEQFQYTRIYIYTAGRCNGFLLILSRFSLQDS